MLNVAKWQSGKVANYPGARVVRKRGLYCISREGSASFAGMFGVGCADAWHYMAEGIPTKQSRHRREVRKASEQGLEVISSPPKLGGEEITQFAQFVLKIG